jgi:hypothetical protein
VTAAVVVGASACGGSDSTAQLDSWAKSVCGGVAAPIQSVQSAQGDTGQIIPGEAPAALQTRLAADMGKLATGNQQIAQAVQAAGAPKTDGGAQLQADAVSELNQAAGGYTKVQATVKALSVTDQARFAAALRGVSDQVQQLSTLSSGALQKLQTGDLGAALKRQPGCAQPSGTPTPSTGDTASSAPSASTPAGASASARTSAKPSASTTPKPSASAH